MVLSSWPVATARVHPVHLTNVGQRRAAADRPTKPTDLGVESACIGCYDLHQPSPFIITQPEGWYSFYRPTDHGGWKAESTYLFILFIEFNNPHKTAT